MFELNTKFDADSLLYLLSHFECDGHTVHVLTQWYLLPPLTSTIKPSLFMHTHSGVLSLAVRLHDVTQTILIILTMAGLFPVCMCVYVGKEREREKEREFLELGFKTTFILSH